MTRWYARRIDSMPPSPSSTRTGCGASFVSDSARPDDPAKHQQPPAASPPVNATIRAKIARSTRWTRRLSQSIADASFRCASANARVRLLISRNSPVLDAEPTSDSKPTGCSPKSGARSRVVTSACSRLLRVPSSVTASASTPADPIARTPSASEISGATVGGVATGTASPAIVPRASPPPAAAQRRIDATVSTPTGRPSSSTTARASDDDPSSRAATSFSPSSIRHVTSGRRETTSCRDVSCRSRRLPPGCEAGVARPSASTY